MKAEGIVLSRPPGFVMRAEFTVEIRGETYRCLCTSKDGKTYTYQIIGLGQVERKEELSQEVAEFLEKASKEEGYGGVFEFDASKQPDRLTYKE